MDNDVCAVDIFKGKISEYVSANVDYKVAKGGAETLLLTKGYYTLAGIAYSKNVQFPVTREKWSGITKIMPANNGEIVGVQGSTFHI